MLPLWFLAIAQMGTTNAIPSLNMRSTIETVPANTQQEIWKIDTLDMRMMTMDSGLPGSLWPDTYRFDTSINVSLSTMRTLNVPGGYASTVNVTAACSAEWPNGTLLRGVGWQCPYQIDQNDGVNLTELGQFYFWLEQREGANKVAALNREELWYSLRMIRNGTGTGSGLYIGGIDVSANEPNSTSGFLTCLNGPPLDGLRCKKGVNNGIDLSNGAEMKIVAELQAGDLMSSVTAGIEDMRILPPGGRM